MSVQAGSPKTGYRPNVVMTYAVQVEGLGPTPGKERT
jgi:hypothetical protein